MLVVCIFASALGALVMCVLVLRPPVSPADPARADRDLLVSRLGHATAGVCFATTAILAAVLVARTPAPPVRSAVSAPDPRVTERLVTLDRERHVLGEQVAALGATVQALREQVGAVGGNVQSVRARLDQADGRVASVEAGLKRLGDDVATARARQVERPVATRPVAGPARAPAVHPATRTPLRRAPASEAESSSESASPQAETVLPAPVTRAPVTPVTVMAPKPAPAAEPPAPQPLPSPSLGDKVRSDWDKVRRGFASAGDEIASAFRDIGRRVRGRD